MSCRKETREEGGQEEERRSHLKEAKRRRIRRREREGGREQMQEYWERMMEWRMREFVEKITGDMAKRWKEVRDD